MMSRLLTCLTVVAAGRVIWLAVSYFEGGRVGRYRLEAAWMVLALLALASLLRSHRVPPDAPSVGRPLGTWRPLVLAIAASVVLYWPAVWLGLFSDDFTLLNFGTGSILHVGGWTHFRPVPLMAWKLLYPLGAAPALHLLNIVLHGVNAWLTARVAAHIGHRRSVCAIAGAIVLTFPAIEPVAWNSGVFDVAMVTFGLLFLEACLVGRGVTLSLFWLSGALLSKETAVVLPLIALLLLLPRGVSVRYFVSSMAVTLGYVGLRFMSGLEVPARESASIRYAIKEAVVRPFASLGIPYTGTELARYPLILGVLNVALVAFLVGLYCVHPRARARPIVCAALVLLGVLPLWQFVFIGDALEGARYLYLPLVGWSLLLSDLIDYDCAWLRHTCGAAILIVLVLPGAWHVRQHLHTWRDAAQLRDEVIESASQALASSGCSVAHFRDVPDSWQGVYVFRNGFREALHGRAVQADDVPSPACTFVWTAGRFVAIN